MKTSNHLNLTTHTMNTTTIYCVWIDGNRMRERAVECELLPDGETYRPVAAHNADPEFTISKREMLNPNFCLGPSYQVWYNTRISRGLAISTCLSEYQKAATLAHFNLTEEVAKLQATIELLRTEILDVRSSAATIRQCAPPELNHK